MLTMGYEFETYAMLLAEARKMTCALRKLGPS